ncbi:hypothetical protein N7507_002077 [Penicillium longicatenatum]|nr:hypothetical protein N7507_002077 [Penicillium longicatenatum]
MAFLLAGLLLLAAAQAATVEPVALHCYNLPMWQATGISSGFSGPWALIVDQCVNTTDVNNACTMEGFRSRSSSIDQQVDKGYIGIVGQQYSAITPLRCIEGTGFVVSVLTTSGTAEFRTVNITDVASEANIGYGLGADTEMIQAYNHYIDGVKQDGIFIGAHNVTTWGMQLQGGAGAWWKLRLLGPGSEDASTGNALKDGEYQTFIRIDGS